MLPWGGSTLVSGWYSSACIISVPCPPLTRPVPHAAVRAKMQAKRATYRFMMPNHALPERTFQDPGATANFAEDILCKLFIVRLRNQALNALV